VSTKYQNIKTQTTEALNVLLATISDFYFTYKYFHWNITGQDFHEFHILFDAHALIIFPNIDLIAERIKQIEDIAYGDFKTYLENTKIDINRPITQNNIQAILKYLVAQHDAVISLLETIIDHTDENKDVSTSDLLTGFLKEQQQMRWFIDASIEK
jgi:starvation-inducible DNA-binding protein